MKKILVLLFSAWQVHTALAQMPSIIPQPVQITANKGQFRINSSTTIVATDEEDRRAAGLFNEYLLQVYGFQLHIQKADKATNSIRLTTKKFIRAPDKDAYTLLVGPSAVSIEGDTYTGTFYGLQTLIQLLPVPPSGTSLALPCCTIKDYPRFAYRGMHLDVCRHFFPVSFVKKYIDYLTFHKMNYFHWHLTEDQGWRIEIKKYPRLTSVGGFRNGTIIGRYPGTGNDNQRYGGFYTQDEIREVVQYAADRHITVVPEIEMPGHSSAAIAAYPWLSCFPNERTVIPSHPSLASQQSNGKLVQETWGVFDDVYCAGNDSTFLFLQDVMDEVIALFPSPYIHVGGDECPKNNWKRCPRCQARMKALGLKDEHELQAYFIQRMEKYLNSKGRRLIGWDEILEGGLASNALVMSWRGQAGGIEAAGQDHQVIMTPEKPVYFDHSQSKNEDSLVIGGYNPLEEVYAFEPVPKALDTSKAKYILGGQANLWTEYITNERKVEYMIFPRLSALAEVLWSPKEKRSWADFEQRLPTQMQRYDAWKANYSKAYYNLKASILPAPGNNGLLWKIESRKKRDTILFYNSPASENCIEMVEARKRGTFARAGLQPLPYTKLIRCSGFYGYYALRRNGDSTTIMQEFMFSKSTGKKISITRPPNEKYPGQGGAFSLVNGVYSKKGLSYPDWLGWIGDDLDATIDLGTSQTFDSVRLHTLDQNGSWIYLPSSVTVWTSSDGRHYTQAGTSATFVRDTLTMGWITVPVPHQKSRFVRILAKNYGLIPDGHPGAGNKAWLFVDEIIVVDDITDK
jgi:hexosaminidase